ncbi:hypothetical protein DFQ29_009632 [Apophysomyces sp. BC1021]|nr:hypothetical protein DFQ29_009632 [Apophysomyces sp. BC1021]
MIDTSSTHFIDAVLHGGNADAHTGPMYKGNALSDTEEANLVYLGDDPKLYTKDVYKLEDKGTDKALQKNDSLGPLIQFTRLLQSIDPSQATDAQHQGNLSTLIDPQHTLLHLAMNFLSGSWDGLWFQASNYYLTQDNTQTNHWTVVTYDFDETFGIDPESKPLLNISYQNFGKPNAKRPLVDALLRSPYWQSQFEQVLKTLIKRFFKPSAIEPRLQAWKAMLQQDISWDRSLQPRSPGTKTTWTESDFEKNMDSALNNDAMGLMEWIKARSAATCQQLQINDNDDLPALGPYSGGNHWNQGAENNGANPAADKPKNAAAAITLSQQNAISVFVMTTILVLFQSM